MRLLINIIIRILLIAVIYLLLTRFLCPMIGIQLGTLPAKQAYCRCSQPSNPTDLMNLSKQPVYKASDCPQDRAFLSTRNLGGYWLCRQWAFFP